MRRKKIEINISGYDRKVVNEVIQWYDKKLRAFLEKRIDAIPQSRTLLKRGDRSYQFPNPPEFQEGMRRGYKDVFRTLDLMRLPIINNDWPVQEN